MDAASAGDQSEAALQFNERLKCYLLGSSGPDVSRMTLNWLDTVSVSFGELANSSHMSDDMLNNSLDDSVKTRMKKVDLSQGMADFMIANRVTAQELRR